MIGTWDVALNAAEPRRKLPPLEAFVGSPSSVRLRGVPRKIGTWNITAVTVSVNYPDNSSRSANCVLVGGVWVGTLPASASVGASENGVAVTASGTDENNAAVTGYVLGMGDALVLATDGTITVGATKFAVKLVDAEPASPNKGDLCSIGGVWKIWNGSAWTALGSQQTTVSWNDVTGKPSTFPPSVHSHTASDVGAVPVSQISAIPERFSMNDLKTKINELVGIVSQTALLLSCACCLSLSASAAVTVQKARLDALYNDELVVTNVTAAADLPPDYTTVSNRAMTAAQYEQYLDRSSFGATVDALSAGYLIAKSRQVGITTTSPKVLFGSESIGSEGSVYGELLMHWPGNQLSFKSCKVVRDPDFGRLTVSNLYTVAFPEKSGVLALRDELTVFSADASGKKMSAVTPPDAEGHTTTNSVPYTSYVDAATNGLLSASAAELAYKPISWVPAWGDVTGKPQFAAVATSGSYTDLSNKPDLSAYATEAFVTNRVAAAEALVNQSPCWSTAGAWGIEYKLSATSSSQTIVTGWTNEDGRAWSQMRTHYVRNLEADCFGALYDEITIEALRVGGWRCLTAGGSITAAGHLTANASGVYVVSATNQNGQIRFAEIPISNGAQDVADVEVYVGDVEGTARKAVNDEALAWMNAAPNHGAGIYGTESTWYNWGYFTQPAWAATSAANTGNDKPFALGTKLLAGATHYPDWCKWEGFQTIGSTTVKKGEWVRLDHWALSNGWNGAQVAAMNLSDISLVLVTEGSIPLADCPYLITEAKLNETFAGTLEGVQGWAATQMHTDPIQLVYSTADGTAWRYAMGSECNRLDIKTKLLTMGSAYPIHSGDSGHPVYLHHDNKWVLTSHFYSAANGPSYVKALPVIRAFAASVGCSLNVIE